MCIRDRRLIDPDLPDDPDSKVNICVGKIFEIWEQTMPQRSAQLVFCDLSTPKAGVFNVYDDMKAKLIERGIPEDVYKRQRQDKTKADREAEKGSHYYRQRVCAVCGSTYWPTHSQQKFCSEECKKIKDVYKRQNQALRAGGAGRGGRSFHPRRPQCKEL